MSPGKYNIGTVRRKRHPLILLFLLHRVFLHQLLRVNIILIIKIFHLKFNRPFILFKLDILDRQIPVIIWFIGHLSQLSHQIHILEKKIFGPPGRVHKIILHTVTRPVRIPKFIAVFQKMRGYL